MKKAERGGACPKLLGLPSTGHIICKSLFDSSGKRVHALLAPWALAKALLKDEKSEIPKQIMKIMKIENLDSPLHFASVALCLRCHENCIWCNFRMFLVCFPGLAPVPWRHGPGPNPRAGYPGDLGFS